MILVYADQNACVFDSDAAGPGGKRQAGRSSLKVRHHAASDGVIRVPIQRGKTFCGQFVDGILSTQPITNGKKWERR